MLQGSVDLSFRVKGHKGVFYSVRCSQPLFWISSLLAVLPGPS